MTELTSPTLLLALLAGLGAGGGLALAIAALVGWPRRPRRPGPTTRQRLTDFLRRRAAIAAVAGLLILALTRWPVAAIATVLLVVFWSKLFGGAAHERAALARIEALAAWTESLRDTIAGAAGLEQAIGSSVRAAAPALRPHLVALNDRLRARMPLPDSLTAFADDLDDPAADRVIAALILNSRLRGPGLRDVLGSLATSARAEVDMRRRVFAGRAGTRRSVQIVVAVVVGFVGAMVIFNRAYVEPYTTLVGQIVLGIVLVLFATAFLWLRKLAAVPVPDRFLVKDPQEASR